MEQAQKDERYFRIFVAVFTVLVATDIILSYYIPEWCRS
jgi:hypothetical protein